MNKYFLEKKRLIQLADAVIDKAKEKPINLSIVRYRSEEKFSCGWGVFDKRIKLLLNFDPRYKYDTKTTVLSFDEKKEVDSS